MGCTSSTHSSKRDGGTPLLTDNLPVPRQSAQVEAENLSGIAWKCRPSSLSRSSVLASDLSSIVALPGQQRLKPVNKEEPEEEAETVGARDGLYGKIARCASAFEARKRNLLVRSASVHPVQGVDDESKSFGWRKCSKENKVGRGVPKSEEESMTSGVKARLSSVRGWPSKDANHEASGLRLLLLPADTPSQSFNRSRTLNRSLLSNGTFNLGCRGDNFSAFSETLEVDSNLSASDDEPESPLFDPSILATFEKAVEAVSDDNWLSSDISVGISSDTTFSSSETSSDADSRELPRERGRILQETEFSSTVDSKGIGDNATCKDIDTFSTVPPFQEYNMEWRKEIDLDFFEMRCPPGCEDKLVLYFTSLRGIRKTFEDCCSLRLILKGFRLQVDERDVSMHSKFRQELTDVMGSAVSVPRFFMKGRYIGGADEVKQLHEDGILRKLFEGLPTEWRNVCDVCGGVRFVPCITCSGSCKTISQDDKKSRCPDCNENGLIICPSCDW